MGAEQGHYPHTTYVLTAERHGRSVFYVVEKMELTKRGEASERGSFFGRDGKSN